jgi:uncharacterized alkaline shock family protein YloU
VLNKGIGVLDNWGRLLLIIAGVILLAISVSVIAMATNFEPAIDLGTQLLNKFIYGRWETAFVGVLIMMLALRLINLSLAGRKAKGAIISSSAVGDVTITVAAVENMVQRTVLQVTGIQEVHPTVIAKPDGIVVRIKAWVEKDAHVPELAAEVQEVLGSYLKEVAGLTATSIGVEIQGVGTRTRTAR